VNPAWVPPTTSCINSSARALRTRLRPPWMSPDRYPPRRTGLPAGPIHRTPSCGCEHGVSGHALPSHFARFPTGASPAGLVLVGHAETGAAGRIPRAPLTAREGDRSAGFGIRGRTGWSGRGRGFAACAGRTAHELWGSFAFILPRDGRGHVAGALLVTRGGTWRRHRRSSSRSSSCC